MFHTWTFATPTSGRPQRVARYELKASTRIFLAFESWQLCWKVTSQNISQTGMLCHLEITDEASATVATDLYTLIQAEPEVRLQVEIPNTPMDALVVGAKLVRCTQKPKGLALAFQFSETTDDIKALTDELSGTGLYAANSSH